MLKASLWASWSGEMVSLFLETWELVRVELPLGSRLDMSGNAIGVLPTAVKSLPPWRAVTVRRGVWWENFERRVAEFRKKIGKDEALASPL